MVSGTCPLLSPVELPFLNFIATLPTLAWLGDGCASLVLLAQQTAGDAATAVTPSGPVSPLQVFFNSPLPLIAGLAMIWYLTWFLPEKRKRQEETNLLASLMKNDRVITIGGIHGTVVSVSPDSDVVMLKIDEAGTTRVKVNRSAITAISVHAKGKTLDKDGRPTKAPGTESSSKTAADEDSSD